MCVSYSIPGQTVQLTLAILSCSRDSSLQCEPIITALTVCLVSLTCLAVIDALATLIDCLHVEIAIRTVTNTGTTQKNFRIGTAGACCCSCLAGCAG